MTKNDDKKPDDDLSTASERATDMVNETDVGDVTEVGDAAESPVGEAVGASIAEMHDKVALLGKELEEAKAKVEENWSHFVRTKADLDNLERRAQRDVENAHKYAGEKLLEAMLPVLDSLEMGAEAAKQDATDINMVLQGMELTLKMFEDTLSKFEVKKLDPTGTPFNPEFHQAITLQESTDHAPNTVLSVLQKGYVLNERLIRPAMVVVSKASAKPKESAKPDANSDSVADATNTAESKGTRIDEKA